MVAEVVVDITLPYKEEPEALAQEVLENLQVQLQDHIQFRL